MKEAKDPYKKVDAELDRVNRGKLKAMPVSLTRSGGSISDMMIKGNDPENIKWGSTLSTDEFAGMRFDFMLSNPPYGKSYSTEQKYIIDGKTILDSRFQVVLKNFQFSRGRNDGSGYATLFGWTIAVPDGYGKQNEAASG